VFKTKTFDKNLSNLRRKRGPGNSRRRPPPPPRRGVARWGKLGCYVRRPALCPPGAARAIEVHRHVTSLVPLNGHVMVQARVMSDRPGLCPQRTPPAAEQKVNDQTPIVFGDQTPMVFAPLSTRPVYRWAGVELNSQRKRLQSLKT